MTVEVLLYWAAGKSGRAGHCDPVLSHRLPRAINVAMQRLRCFPAAMMQGRQPVGISELWDFGPCILATPSTALGSCELSRQMQRSRPRPSARSHQHPREQHRTPRRDSRRPCSKIRPSPCSARALPRWPTLLPGLANDPGKLGLERGGDSSRCGRCRFSRSRCRVAAIRAAMTSELGGEPRGPSVDGRLYCSRALTSAPRFQQVAENLSINVSAMRMQVGKTPR